MQRHLVFRKIDALIFLELFDDPFNQSLVDIVAAEMCVTVSRLDFHNPFADFEDRDVERAAAKVEHGNGFILFLVQAVGEGCRGRLVHDTHYFEAGDLSRVFRRLAL